MLIKFNKKRGLICFDLKILYNIQCYTEDYSVFIDNNSSLLDFPRIIASLNNLQ